METVGFQVLAGLPPEGQCAWSAVVPASRLRNAPIETDPNGFRRRIAQCDSLKQVSLERTVLLLTE